jgi:deoxyribonuclease-4
MSISGGVHRAVTRAEDLGMTALQVFTRSARTWAPPALTGDGADLFRATRAASGVRAVVAHATYLANPASPDRNLRRRSERALIDELTRCEALGIPWLILHPGSTMGSPVRGAIRRAGALLGRVLRATSGARAGILVENTAGSGHNLGATFPEVAAVLAAAGDGDRLGACLDTCHAYAAGHDLRSQSGFASVREDLDREVGLDRVRVVHVNDSRDALGSRLDRHAGIGLGELGLAPFRRLVSDPVLGRRPLILETPKGERDGENLDARNLRVLRSLATRARRI